MKPTLAQLAALTAVARFGSFSKAARALAVSQPAVSQQIAALQRTLGLRLIEIAHNKPRLTDAGRFVLERADAVARDVALLLADTRAFLEAQRGRLDVAATLTIGNYLLPELLARFLGGRPNVAPRVTIANTSAVAELVRYAEVHLGLVEGRIDDPELTVREFARDRLLLVVPSVGHRFSHRTSVRPDELDDEPFVSREVGSGTRDFGFDVLIAHGVRPRLALTLQGGEAIVRSVEAGLGLAVLSQCVVERAQRLGALHALDVEGLPLERPLSIVQRRGDAGAPLVRAFAAFVEGRAQEPPPPGERARAWKKKRL